MGGGITAFQVWASPEGHLTRTAAGADGAPYPFTFRACTFTTYVLPLSSFLVRHVHVRAFAVHDVRYFSFFPELR
jgi:hypothetical protein